MEAVSDKTNYARQSLSIGCQDRLAIVVVHFGTTHSDVRAKTIEKINTLIDKKYPNIPVFEAYTSRIVINKLRATGVGKPTPKEVFEELRSLNYTHVLVQSTHIIDGVEMESLRREAQKFRADFKEIRIGNPLLYRAEDYNDVISALEKQIAPNSNQAVVLVGHGTYNPITASYAMMDYMLKYRGLKNWHVGTIEGFPTFNEVVIFLANGEVKDVVLVPFMFVAGEHAKNDIAQDWKENLENLGYIVSVSMEGLGENSRIQQLFLNHLEFAFHNKHLDIMSKKEAYSIEKY